MKVFISWSGERSRQVAEYLSIWLKCVLQFSDPWISTDDVDKGSLWFTEISSALNETSTGIVCLTQENKDKPWILFETGALSKGLGASRVCTLLVDLKPRDIIDPLAQFNHTMPTKKDMLKLVTTLNKRLEGNALQERVLLNVFDTYWNQFEEEYQKIMENTTSKVDTNLKERDPIDITSEILETVRSLDKRMRDVENVEIIKKKRNYSQKGLDNVINFISVRLNKEIEEFINGEISRSDLKLKIKSITSVNNEVIEAALDFVESLSVKK